MYYVDTITATGRRVCFNSFIQQELLLSNILTS